MPELTMQFIQVDPGARAAISNIRPSPMQPWGDTEQFRHDYIDIPLNAATSEHNHNILDGSMLEMPDNAEDYKFGFWSNLTSDSARIFTEPPILDFYFDSPRRSRGLTLYFYPHTDDYADKMRITWFSSWDDADIIKSEEYEASSNIAVIVEPVTAWERIKLEFLSTNIPLRFIKLYAIDFGVTRNLADHEISAVHILEEIDPTAESLSINTMNATIRTRNSIFSPITSLEPDDMMMTRQMLSVRRDDAPFGKFFLEKWIDVNQDGIEFEISAVDAVGVMDSYRFMGGLYSGEPIKNILEELFRISFPSGTIKYILDPLFADATVSGWIPITTCAAALQHICFAINATADTARVGDVLIYPRETDIKSDATMWTDDLQPFVDITDLQSYIPPRYYPTLEPNYTAADATLEEFPDDTSGHNLGWSSLSASDSSGAFVMPPKLAATFLTNHNLDTITLDFGPYESEFMKRMQVVFYDEHDNILSDEIYEFTQNPGIIEGFIRGYRKIDFNVIETSNPRRFAKIMSIDYGKSFYIPLRKQYRRGRDMPATFVSGVNVTSHNYVPSDEITQVGNSKRPLGVNKITFPEPMHSISVEGGVLLEAHANYAIVNVTSQENVLISGKRYINNQRTHSIHKELVSGESENVANFEHYTLVSPERGDMLAQELFDYYSNPIVAENDIQLNDTEIGFIAQVETRGRDIIGVITQLDINLRANRARMEARGNVAATNNR